MLTSKESKSTTNENGVRTKDSPFTQLPIELRVSIYNMLPSKELNLMRLINHQIKFEVEQYIDFDIRIDPLCFSGCQRLLNLRANSCTFSSLSTSKSKKLTFKYPERIRKLTFDGVIPPSTIHRLLCKCKKLRELKFTNESLRYTSPFTRCHKLQNCLETFDYLTHLNIQFTRYPRGDPFVSDENITFFLNSTFRHLSSFKLFYSMWGNWLDLLLFLTRHVQSLRCLELQVGDRNDSINTSSYLFKNSHSEILNVIDRSLLKNLRLQDFRFRDDVLNLNPTVKMIVFEIIAQQRELETFHFYSPEDMIPATFCDLVNANEKTLKEVVTYNLKASTNNNQPGVLPRLDMQIFSKCTKLKVLAISCASPPGPPTLPNDGVNLGIQVTNMRLLPLSLEKLHLTGFKFENDDILALSTNTLSNLNELLLAEAGRLKYPRLLTNFLINCPTLNFLSVNPLEPTGRTLECWWGELQDLSKLYQRFMNVAYDPLSDLDGFEARNISDEDREWVKANMEIRGSSRK